jgi:hypothetical protein
MRALAQYWWLEEGLELCEACGTRYAYEMQRRCVACDAALCWFCTCKNIEGDFVCNECRDNTKA